MTMAKFLFVVPPFFGHISPTLSVGSALLSRGHDVAWVGLRDLPAGRIPEGGQFIVPHKELEGHQDELKWILKRQEDGTSIGGAGGMKLALGGEYMPVVRVLVKEVAG